jgi:lysyl-tRNA synthetase class I
VSEKMTTSEPSTENVEEITNQSTTHDIIVVLKMIVQYLESFTMDKMSRDVMSAAADRLESQEQTIAALTARAEQAEAREKAAIADMKLIVDAVRETHCDETCCFACKHDCDTSINDSGEYNSECPGFYRDDCFEWRGARKGERND